MHVLEYPGELYAHPLTLIHRKYSLGFAQTIAMIKQTQFHTLLSPCIPWLVLLVPVLPGWISCAWSVFDFWTLDSILTHNSASSSPVIDTPSAASYFFHL